MYAYYQRIKWTFDDYVCFFSSSTRSKFRIINALIAIVPMWLYTGGVEKLEFQLNSFFNQKPPNFLIMPSC